MKESAFRFVVGLGIGVGALLSATATAQWTPISSRLQVPAGMTSWPLNTARDLLIPPGTSIGVVARVNGARFLLVLPNGDILVSVPADGTIRLVRERVSASPQIFTFASGLSRPHDMVYRVIDGQAFLYIAEQNRVSRFTYTAGATTIGAQEVLIDNLPDGSLPELQGKHSHALKNIALDRQNRIYLSIASSGNALLADTTSDPIRCAVYRYSATGQNRELIATGIRNAEGLAFIPGTDQLWVTINQRDNILYPYNDNTGWFGQRIMDYVDDHPLEGFTRVDAGKNYGWPFANSSPDSLNGPDFPPFDPDYELNRLWTRHPASIFTRVNKGIQAHSAPLGFSFTHGTKFRPGAAIALHGSWNRQRKTGYKVVYFPWDTPTQLPLGQADLVAGFLDESNNTAWGRPVDVVADNQGNLLISDDYAGAIYRLTGPGAATGGSAHAKPRIYTENVNYSRLEALDYVLWPSRIRKPGANQIEGFNVVGETDATVVNEARTIFYPGGSTKNAVSVAGLNAGFAITAVADTTPRVLRILAGGNGGQARIRVRLSDGSAPESVSLATAQSGPYGGVYTISYRAASPGQRVIVTVTNALSTGSVSLQSAYLRFN